MNKPAFSHLKKAPLSKQLWHVCLRSMGITAVWNMLIKIIVSGTQKQKQKQNPDLSSLVYSSIVKIRVSSDLFAEQGVS